jgi:hypothetical protein
LPDAALTRVIMGCASSAADLAAVRDGLAQRRVSVPLYRAKRMARAFGVEIVPAD